MFNTRDQRQCLDRSRLIPTRGVHHIEFKAHGQDRARASGCAVWKVGLAVWFR